MVSNAFFYWEAVKKKILEHTACDQRIDWTVYPNVLRNQNQPASNIGEFAELSLE